MPHLRCPPEKIVAVVPTDAPGLPHAVHGRPTAIPELIAGHVLDFLTHEVRHGPAARPGCCRFSPAWATSPTPYSAGLDGGPFAPLTAYTEVVQDGMLQMLRSGTLTVASATAFSLSEDGLADLRANIAAYRDKIILRPQEISNSNEVIRRLGVIAINTMIEGAYLFGNVNSTHVMGRNMMNGIGGSGDFTRNAYLSNLRLPLHGQKRRHQAPLFRWSATRTIASIRCAGLRYRVRRGGPARPLAGRTRPAYHRRLRASGLPAPRCTTTSTAPPPPGPAGTLPTCWARHCHGMCGT